MKLFTLPLGVEDTRAKFPEDDNTAYALTGWQLPQLITFSWSDDVIREHYEGWAANLDIALGVAACDNPLCELPDCDDADCMATDAQAARDRVAVIEQRRIHSGIRPMPSVDPLADIPEQDVWEGIKSTITERTSNTGRKVQTVLVHGHSWVIGSPVHDSYGRQIAQTGQSPNTVASHALLTTRQRGNGRGAHDLESLTDALYPDLPRVGTDTMTWSQSGLSDAYTWPTRNTVRGVGKMSAAESDRCERTVVVIGDLPRTIEGPRTVEPVLIGKKWLHARTATESPTQCHVYTLVTLASGADDVRRTVSKVRTNRKGKTVQVVNPVAVLTDAQRRVPGRTVVNEQTLSFFIGHKRHTRNITRTGSGATRTRTVRQNRTIGRVPETSAPTTRRGWEALISALQTGERMEVDTTDGLVTLTCGAPSKKYPAGKLRATDRRADTVAYLDAKHALALACKLTSVK